MACIILIKLTGVNMAMVLVYFCGQSLGTYIYMRAAKCLTIVVPVLRLVNNIMRASRKKLLFSLSNSIPIVEFSTNLIGWMQANPAMQRWDRN